MGSPTAPTPLLIRQLCAGRGYPHPVAQVRLIETHISWVLLTGTDAYKIKKPVAPGFLDFSTLERRRAACDEELRLNRRLAPELYFGVVPITGSAAEPCIGGPGSPIEFAVWMREFPGGALLSELLQAGGIEPAELQAFAERLAAFHAALPPAPPGADWGSPAAVGQPLGQTLDQLADLLAGDPSHSALLPAARTRLRALLADRAALIEVRRRAGRVRECHGDLHLGNLVRLDAGITAFDALEFDPALRWIDVINEVAFLLMDLLVRDQAPLAWAFLNRYLQAGGDYEGLGVLELYLGYRALVRAKVGLLPGASRHAQPGISRLLAFAGQPLGPGRPCIVIMCGVSGSGKSWLAERLAPLLGAIHVRSDLERKRLAGVPALATTGSAPDAGIYSAASSAATYDRLRTVAGIVVTNGLPAVVDATHLTVADRAPLLALGREFAVPTAVVYCHGRKEVLAGRIEARRSLGQDPSEADAGILSRQLGRLVPPTRAETPCLIELSTDETDVIQRVAAFLGSLRGESAAVAANAGPDDRRSDPT